MKRTDKRTWLLALDGSRAAERAARYVARVAKRQGVDEILLVSVQPPDGVRAHTLPSAQISRAAGEAAKRATASARRLLEAAGLALRLHSPLGTDPAMVIAGTARRQRACEIVMGTQGMSAVRNLALGSVAYKVMHLARGPVTLVPRPREGCEVRLPPARGALAVLLAVDGSMHATRATAYVCGLHEAGVPLRVHLLNVQPRVLSGSVRSFVSQAQINAYYRKQGEIAQRGPRRLLDRAGVEYQCHIRAGACADTIADLARERGCTRIVMGTRGLGAVKGLVLGSVTYGVVHLAQMPVTLVK